MADHVIDARATAFGVAQVSERCRGVLVRKRVLVDESIDLARGYASLNLPPDIIHQLGVKATGRAHSLPLRFGEL